MEEKDVNEIDKKLRTVAQEMLDILKVYHPNYQAVLILKDGPRVCILTNIPAGTSLDLLKDARGILLKQI